MPNELNRVTDAVLAYRPAPTKRKEDSVFRDFTKSIPQALLDIEDKNRSNLFPWRGQFSPQLIECILDAYCLPNSSILDSFMGSGTVLYEAAAKGLNAFGYEINPAAWNFSKLYEFCNMTPDAREGPIRELQGELEKEFPIVIFENGQLPLEEMRKKVVRIMGSVRAEATTLCNALVVSLDVFNHNVSNAFIQSKFATLVSLVRSLPYSSHAIRANLQDARALLVPDQSIDFSVTSPPYINVFNYHQNYRKSVEVLGWDLLRVARSEIGSNRANRGNRFCTVVQYCIDMAGAIQELARVLKPNGRAVFVVGHESNVLGTPFYNADIIEQIALRSGMFDVPLRQQRVFTNRFGKPIREDLLNLMRKSCTLNKTSAVRLGRSIAREAFSSALQAVPEKNRHLLTEAVSRVDEISGTPLFDSYHCTTNFQASN